MQNPSDICKIRPGTLKDLPFIANSWLRSYRNNCRYLYGVPSEIYYREQHALIERLLTSKGIQVLVACSPDDDEQIFSYCVAQAFDETLCIHWIYSKQPLRKFGLISALIQYLQPEKFVHKQYSHRTTQAIDTLAEKYKFVFNPFAK